MIVINSCIGVSMMLERLCRGSSCEVVRGPAVLVESRVRFRQFLVGLLCLCGHYIPPVALSHVPACVHTVMYF